MHSVSRGFPRALTVLTHMRFNDAVSLSLGSKNKPIKYQIVVVVAVVNRSLSRMKKLALLERGMEREGPRDRGRD